MKNLVLALEELSPMREATVVDSLRVVTGEERTEVHQSQGKLLPPPTQGPMKKCRAGRMS